MTCPYNAVDVLNLTPFLACINSYQIGKPSSTVATYFTTGQDRQCVATKDACYKARDYVTCRQATVDVVHVLFPASLAPNATAAETCNIVYGYVASTACPMAFGDYVKTYCPDPLPFQVGTVVGAVVGGLAGLVFLMWLYGRWKRSVRLEKEIEGALMAIPQDALLKPPPGLGPAQERNIEFARSPGQPQVQPQHQQQPRQQSYQQQPYSPPQQQQQQQPRGGGGQPHPQFLGVRRNVQNPGAWDAVVQMPGGGGAEQWLGTYATAEEAAVVYDMRVLQLRESGAAHLALNFPLHAMPAEWGGQQQQTVPMGVSKNDADGFRQIMGGGGGGARPPQQQQQQLAPLTPQHQMYMQEVAQGQRSHVPSIHAPAGGIVVPRYKEDAATRERHINELILFYMYYGDTSPNLEAKVRGLFDKYSFLGLARAVRNKYGVLPAGWEEEVMRVHSHNFSERFSRLFGMGGSGAAAGRSSKFQQQMEQQQQARAQNPQW